VAQGEEVRRRDRGLNWRPLKQRCKCLDMCHLFVSSAIIGLLYPYFDHQLGESQCYKQEWSSVMRCIAVFVGINHASAVSLQVALRIAFFRLI